MWEPLNKGIPTTLSIAIIVILAVILVGGILGYQYLWVPKEIKPLEVEIPKDETATWKTYRNEKYGFGFKYPLADENGKKLELFELSSYEDYDFSVLVKADYGEDVWGGIFFVNYESMPIDTQIEKIKNAYNKKSQFSVNVTDLQLFGTEGKKITVVGLLYGHTNNIYMLVDPNNKDGTIIIDEQKSSYFPLILDTFRFIKR